LLTASPPLFLFFPLFPFFLFFSPPSKPLLQLIYLFAKVNQVEPQGFSVQVRFYSKKKRERGDFFFPLAALDDVSFKLSRPHPKKKRLFFLTYNSTARPHLRRPDRRQRPAPGSELPAHRDQRVARRGGLPAGEFNF